MGTGQLIVFTTLFKPFTGARNSAHCQMWDLLNAQYGNWEGKEPSAKCIQDNVLECSTELCGANAAASFVP